MVQISKYVMVTVILIISVISPCYSAGLAKLASQEDRAAERLLERGDMRLDAGQKKEAIALFQTVIDRYPKSKFKYKRDLPF